MKHGSDAQAGFNAPRAGGRSFVFVLTLAALVFFANHGGAAAQPDNAPSTQRDASGLAAEVPYRIDYDGWLTVDVTINGEGPYAFIIDTGATLTLVFQRLAEAQQYPLADKEPVRILGLASEGELPAIVIGDIALGAARLENHTGVALADWAPPRKTPDGVLGVDFLSKYILVFDRPNQILRLYRPGSSPPGVARWRSTRLKSDDFGFASGALYTLKGKLRDKRVRFILDLGASGTLVNTAAFSSLITGVSVSTRSTSHRRRSARIAGAFDIEEKAVLLDVDVFRIGGTTWRRRRFLIYNAPIFEELGVTRQSFGLMGADLVANRSFAIDFQGGRIYFGPEYKG